MNRNLAILKQSFLTLFYVCLFLGLLVVAIKLAQSHAYAINSLQLIDNTALNFPFEINRGWDLPALFLYVILLWYLPSKKNKNNELTDLVISIPLGASIGLIFSLVASFIASSLLASLVICLVIGGLVTILFGVLGSFKFGIGSVAGLSLATGIVTGLLHLETIGLALGFIISLFFFITICLLIMLIRLLGGSNLEEKEETKDSILKT